MKRVKIMLLSLLVLATVGGVLAFKAKFESDYCSAPAVQQAGGAWVCPAGCPNYTTNSQIIASTTNNRFCTTVSNGVATRPCKNANDVVTNCVTPVLGLEDNGGGN